MEESRILKVVEARLASQYPDKEIKSVRFQNQNMLDGRVSLPIEYKISWTAKSGRKMQNTGKVYFFPPFDPFTGEALLDGGYEAG